MFQPPWQGWGRQLDTQALDTGALGKNKGSGLCQTVLALHSSTVLEQTELSGLEKVLMPGWLSR